MLHVLHFSPASRGLKTCVALFCVGMVMLPLVAHAGTFSCKWTGSACVVDSTRYTCGPEEGTLGDQNGACATAKDSTSCGGLTNLGCYSTGSKVLKSGGRRLQVDYPAVPAPVKGFLFDLNCFEGGDLSQCTAPYIFKLTLGNVVLFIFLAAIWASAIIAFVSGIYAGVLYILSGANAGMRARARQRITSTVWGVAILLLATIGFNFINPDIASLKLTGEGIKNAGGAPGGNPAGSLNVNYPPIPIPGFDLSGGVFDLNEIWQNNRSELTIGVLFAIVYAAAIWLAGFIALTSLAYSGVLFIISGASPAARSRARERLLATVWGVAIVLLAAAALSVVNEDIRSLKITGQHAVISQEPKEPTLDTSYNGHYKCEVISSGCITLNYCKTAAGYFPTVDCEKLSSEDCKKEADRGFLGCTDRNSPLTINTWMCRYNATNDTCDLYEACDEASGYMVPILCNTLDKDTCIAESTKGSRFCVKP